MINKDTDKGANMLINKIGQELELGGFRRISVNVQGIDVFYSVVKDDIYLLNLIQAYDGLEFSREQLLNIIRQLKQNFADTGYKHIQLLNIICTENPEKARGLFLEKEPIWLYDINVSRLIIYEDQPGHFLNVKDIIESMHIINPTPKRQKKISLFNSIIISLNVIVFIIIEITGSSTNVENMVQWGAMYWPYVKEYSQYYRLLTHIFLHFGIQHLFNNMLILAVIGDNLERLVGRIKYLSIYLLSGILAGTASMVYNMVQDREIVSAGASGSVFGVVGAMVYIVSVNRGRVEDISTKQLVIFSFLSLYSGLSSQGVDNVAHIGGLLSGVILAFILYRKNKG